MDYLKHYAPAPGNTTLATPGDGGLRLLSFGILRLRPGETQAVPASPCETALVPLGGVCSVSGDGFAFSRVGARPDVFSGKPHTVYIPCRQAFQITAVTELELIWATAPSTLQTPAYCIPPEQVREVHLGRDNYQRDAYMILTDNCPSAHFFIGEAFVPSGNHASFPPHRHEFDRLPDEIAMEEVYFFRFQPAQGYGIQKIYTDDHSINFTGTVRQNDATLIPRGYHPVVNAPGYTMYYFWVMAGWNHRAFLSVVDPDHRWLTRPA